MGWIVLYDEDCGFCRWGVDLLLRLDRRQTLEVVPIQSAEGADLLSSMSPDERLESWHVRSPDGHLWSGGVAVPPVLRLLPGGNGLASVASRFPCTVDRLYRFVARNRSTLGRLVGARACAVDPSARTSGVRPYAGTNRNTGPESDST
ncbi:MAG: thiol-disulfide oxidoreductase DCC family protein [Actinomycetota bacterium]